MFSAFFPALLAIGRQQEHGAQTGGNLHQRASRSRDGFMSKRQARELQACVEWIRAANQPFFGLLPQGGSLDFRDPVGLDRIELDPAFASGDIQRAAVNVSGPLYSRTARPGWLVYQVPKTGVSQRVFDVTFPAVTTEKTWIVPIFTDLPQNPPGLPSVYASLNASIGMTAGGAIDGDNFLSVQIQQWGGYGLHPENIWSIDFAAVEGGIPIGGAPTKMVSGAPPAALVFVKGDDKWHLEVLTASGHAAHVSPEFTCDINPDRVSLSALTSASASHALVRGIQGVYAFDSDTLVL
jgi:hypothetical protein